MNLLPLNPCLIQGTNPSVSSWMETMKKAFVIYEEDFDLSIETLLLCVCLVKIQDLMKRHEQWEVKSLLSLIGILLLLIQAPLWPHHSLGFHGTKNPLATQPELHKSDFYCGALLLISILWRLYIFLSFQFFSGKFTLKGMPGSVYISVCVCIHVHRRGKKGL